MGVQPLVGLTLGVCDYLSLLLVAPLALNLALTFRRKVIHSAPSNLRPALPQIQRSIYSKANQTSVNEKACVISSSSSAHKSRAWLTQLSDGVRKTQNIAAHSEIITSVNKAGSSERF